MPAAMITGYRFRVEGRFRSGAVVAPAARPTVYTAAVQDVRTLLSRMAGRPIDRSVALRPVGAAMLEADSAPIGCDLIATDEGTVTVEAEAVRRTVGSR